MLEHSLLTTVEAFILLLTVVHAFSQGGSSACSHAKLAYESKGINLLEIPASVVSGTFVFYLHMSVCPVFTCLSWTK